MFLTLALTSNTTTPLKSGISLNTSHTIFLFTPAETFFPQALRNELPAIEAGLNGLARLHGALLIVPLGYEWLRQSMAQAGRESGVAADSRPPRASLIAVLAAPSGARWCPPARAGASRFAYIM